MDAGQVSISRTRTLIRWVTVPRISPSLSLSQFYPFTRLPLFLLCHLFSAAFCSEGEKAKNPETKKNDIKPPERLHRDYCLKMPAPAHLPLLFPAPEISFSSLPLPPSQFLSAERCWQPRHNNLALLWNCHSGSSAVQRFPTYGARAKRGVTSRRCHWTVPLQGGGGTGNYLQQSTMQSCLTTPVQNVVTFSISQLRGSSRDREEGKGYLKSEV